MADTLIPIGECPTHGYVAGENVQFNFPAPATCEKCGQRLTECTVASVQTVREHTDASV